MRVIDGLGTAGAAVWNHSKNFNGAIGVPVIGVTGTLVGRMTWVFCTRKKTIKKMEFITQRIFPTIGSGVLTYFGIKALCSSQTPFRAITLVSLAALALKFTLFLKRPEWKSCILFTAELNTLMAGSVLTAIAAARAFGVVKSAIAASVIGVTGALLTEMILRVYHLKETDEKISMINQAIFPIFVSGIAAYFGIKAICSSPTPLRVFTLVSGGALSFLTAVIMHKAGYKEYAWLGNILITTGLSAFVTGSILTVIAAGKAFGLAKA